MLHGFCRFLLLQYPQPSRLLPPTPFSSIAFFHPPYPTTQTNPKPNSSSSSSFDLLLQQCTTPRQPKQIHAQLLLSGAHHHPHQSAFLTARLVSVYSRFGLLSDARSVFRVAGDTSNSLLWNSILRANLSHGHPNETLILYHQMKSLRALPDGFTFPLIIRACSIVADIDLCRTIHGHAVIMGYHSHLHVANELIVMYGNIGRMELARWVFDAMPQRNVVSWNTLISGFSLNCEYETALDVFRQMESVGPEPNVVTWTSLLSAHARCQRHNEAIMLFDEMRARGSKATAEAVAVVLSVYSDAGGDSLGKAKEIHCYAIRTGFEGYVFVRNSLICMYGKLGNRGDAERLFSETEVKNLVSWNALISSYSAAGLCSEAYEVFLLLEKTGEVRPNVVSWTAVIGGFMSSGMMEQSLELFRRMQDTGVLPNSVTIASVLSACAELSALRLGREIHGHTIRGVMNGNLLVANGLLHMYVKSGSLKDGHLVFERIGEKDLISWNSMVAGYGMHGFCDDALRTFSNMVRAGFEPDRITFVAVLSACSHTGHVSEGRELFDLMVREYKLSPGVEHYACMVDLLGRAGLLREASELVEKMPMKPNACVWGALLNSSRIHGNTAMAEESAMQISGLEVETTGSYILLSNMYAATGRWEDSARVRIYTKEKGLKKNPGQSWIEVKKKVYVFSSGSALSLGLEEVYAFLENLNRQMESENYITRDWIVLDGVGIEGEATMHGC